MTFVLKVDTLLLYEELSVALWKRHRAGLDDPDPLECWDAKGADGNDAKRPCPGVLQRKASILKQPKRIIKKGVRRVSVFAGTEDVTPRFADVPAEQPLSPPQSPPLSEQPDTKKVDRKRPDVEEAHSKHHKGKQPAGRKLRSKAFGSRRRRRQSFAEKAHVFKDSDRFHVPQDQRPDVPPSAVHLLGASTNPLAVSRLQASGFPVASPPTAGTVVAFGPPSLTSSQGSMAPGVRISNSSLDSQAQRSLRSQRRVSLAVASVSPEPDAGGGPRIFRGTPATHPDPPPEPSGPSRQRVSEARRPVPEVPCGRPLASGRSLLQRNQQVLAALCVCGNMTSVAGSIASYWFMPAAEAIAANIHSSSLSFWSWTLITLPVSLAASALSSVCVYYGSLHAQDLITCFLGAIVLLASAALSSLRRTGMSGAPKLSAEQFRGKVDVDGDETPDFRPDPSQCLASLTSRLPWGVIVTYGAASVITRVAETTGLAKVAFDNQFWSQQSDLVKQVLLTIASSLMAEFMTAAALCNAILPIVINLSTDTDHDALYFGLPVAVGASVNTILPLSLPLVMLHDMAPVTRKQLILTGAFVKTVVVASILLSMNTTGEYVLHSTKQFNSTQIIQST
ncbi:hypothetical protein HPB50_022863 [Hyalomma asiaticum]|uniref:Uncharacterized protein n=1 Tax=Hyalomma asiaticum TaxID=266040 RepID=A0ACB7SHV3_HYAAI|nr:hypothetical protein HPB50_022863 [Hyalomma asiaticum]